MMILQPRFLLWKVASTMPQQLIMPINLDAVLFGNISLKENKQSNLPLLPVAIQLFSVVPSQASCERNFSILKWLSGGNRQSLSSETLEKIAKNRVLCQM